MTQHECKIWRLWDECKWGTAKIAKHLDIPEWSIARTINRLKEEHRKERDDGQ